MTQNTAKANDTAPRGAQDTEDTEMQQSSGIPAPNYTQTPNVILDAMPLMSNCCLRVVLAVTRQTFGWQKRQVEMSLSDLQKLTGLSRRGVIDGMIEARQNGILTRRAKDKNDPREGYLYGLNITANAPSQTTWKRLEKPKKAAKKAEIVNVVHYQNGAQEVVNDVHYEAEKVVNDVHYSKRKSLVLNKEEEGNSENAPEIAASSPRTENRNSPFQRTEPQAPPEAKTANPLSLALLQICRIDRQNMGRSDILEFPKTLSFLRREFSGRADAEIAAELHRRFDNWKLETPPHLSQIRTDWLKRAPKAETYQAPPQYGRSLAMFAEWERAANAR